MVERTTKEYIDKKLNHMDVEFTILYKDIDFLLSLFEEAGMLPPPYPKYEVEHTYEGGVYNPKLGITQYKPLQKTKEFVMSYEWETENETQMD